MKEHIISISGTVQTYLLKPEGKVDGLLLSDGKKLHLPKHLSAALQQAVRPGDNIEANVEPGDSSPFGREFRTLSLTNSQTGQTIADCLPDTQAQSTPDQPLSVEGSVVNWLVGHKGELKGLILSDGTQLHVPRPMRETVAAGVKIGDRVSVQGDGVRSDLGTSLMIADLNVNGQPLPVVNRKDVKHYKQAAEHHEQAAHHHQKAAKYYEAGEYEKAGHHAQTANEHHLQALHYVEVAVQQKASETL